MSKHDGMSFKVEGISWVDEGAGRGEERGGEARRKRLKALMRPPGSVIGPPVRLNMVGKELDSMKEVATTA